MAAASTKREETEMSRMTDERLAEMRELWRGYGPVQTELLDALTAERAEVARMRRIVDEAHTERDRLKAGWHHSDKELDAARTKVEILEGRLEELERLGGNHE